MKKYRFFSAVLTLALLLATAVPALALEAPELTCGAAILVDGDHGDVLFEKNGYEKMYPASITKIMTSLLVLEAIEDGQLTLDTPITASETAIAAITADSSTQNIQPGEILTVEQLLYCDLVASANEACNILAETVAGSISAFVDLMNQKAAELGMENTHFVNPSGLHDPEHYTTAYDIYLMAHAAMQYETFRTIVSTARYVVPATNMSGERNLYTTNALIDNWRIAGYTYSKAIGIKTGTTDAAGQCLAAAAVDEQGRTFYCVVLNAQNVVDSAGNTTRYSFKESRDLLEWGFANFERMTLMDDTTLIREVAVTLSNEQDYVLAEPRGSVERTMPTDYDPELAEYRVDLPESVEAPVEAGDVLGTVTLIYEGEEYGTLDLVAADGVARSDFQYYLKTIQEYLNTWWVRALLIVLAVLILVLILYLGVIRPHRRSRNRYRRRTYSGSRRSRYSGQRRRRY